MLFSSLQFLVLFLPIVVVIYYCLKPLPIWVRNIWLFCTSVFFYAWGEPRFVLIMLGTIVLNYGVGMVLWWCDQKPTLQKCRSIALAVGIVLDLGVLFTYKYLDFSIASVNRLFGSSLAPVGLVLPIGISFYTFQAISYIVDVYRRKSPVQKNPLNVGLYIAFFPQLIAGPIVRYDSIATMLQTRNESVAQFAEGIKRFVIGFCKKILIANVCGMLADDIFGIVATETPIASPVAWLGMISYTLQIFFDFSGYSDMAIGLGKLFGFEFNENFHYPYIAKSVSDFWRRWHISLGQWFRDYVYIPLGGSRVSAIRLVCNTFAVWFLTGLWHGANWTFIAWGLLYFVLISIEKLLKLEKRESKLFSELYRIFVLFAVMVGWVLFRSPSISRALLYIQCLFRSAGFAEGLQMVQGYVQDTWAVLLAGVILSTPIVPWLQGKLASSTSTVTNACKCAVTVLRPLCYMLFFLYAMSFLIMDFYNPFIYFNF